MLLLYSMFCWPLFFSCVLCFGQIISPTFWWLRHGFLNSRSALSFTHCILHRHNFWNHQEWWNSWYSHLVLHLCDIWRRWSENTSQLIPFSLKTTRLKPDTRIVYLKKWFWDKFQNARSVRFQALRSRYDTYASFKISAKLLDEGDINEVLNFWKWPQEVVLECYKCPLMTRFEPRSWHPNRCLMPLTSSYNEQKLLNLIK